MIVHNTLHKHGSLNDLFDAMTALRALCVIPQDPPPPQVATQACYLAD